MDTQARTPGEREAARIVASALRQDAAAQDAGKFDAIGERYDDVTARCLAYAASTPTRSRPALRSGTGGPTLEITTGSTTRASHAMIGPALRATSLTPLRSVGLSAILSSSGALNALVAQVRLPDLNGSLAGSVTLPNELRLFAARSRGKERC
jgi:hypothetical protein